MINMPSRKRKRLQRSRFSRTDRLSCTPILTNFPMAASYARLQKASHSVRCKMGAVLEFRLVIREDFSMKSSQEIATNLEEHKKRLFASRKRAGIHQTPIWNGVTIHAVLLCWKAVGTKLPLPPAAGGSACSWGKRAALGSSVLWRQESSLGS